MFRLFAKTLALCPVIAILIGVNFAVDPGNLFHDGCENQIARALLAGNRVALGTFFDLRVVQKEIIEELRVPRDLIVLGSSRGMQVRSRRFTGVPIFNHSVTAAEIEDFLAIYEIYLSKQMAPRTVLMELDPWMISAGPPTLLGRLAAEYEIMCRTLGIKPRAALASRWFESRYAQLISPNYFQVSVRTWFDNSGKLIRSCDAIANHVYIADALTVLADGSVEYPRDVSERPPLEQRREALKFLRPAWLNARPQFDVEKKIELEAFLRFLLRQGVEVVLLLPPFSPLMLNDPALRQIYSAFATAESYYVSLAADYKLSILGSYDPVLSGCDEREFVDLIHPKESCIGRIVDKWSHHKTVQNPLNSGF